MQRAFVCLTTEPATTPRVLEQVKTIEGVQEIEMVYGAYDICFKVGGDTIDKLKNTVNKRIRGIDSVRETLFTVFAKPE